MRAGMVTGAQAQRPCLRLLGRRGPERLVPAGRRTTELSGREAGAGGGCGVLAGGVQRRAPPWSGRSAPPWSGSVQRLLPGLLLRLRRLAAERLRETAERGRGRGELGRQMDGLLSAQCRGAGQRRALGWVAGCRNGQRRKSCRDHH